MGKVVKAIGKVVSAPVRGVGHALRTSGIPLVSNLGGAAENVGNAFAGKGAFLRDIGKAGESAAPIAGLIPGVGPLLGGAIGAGGALLNRGFTKGAIGEGLKYGGEGALSGALTGGKGFHGLGDIPSNALKLGKGLKGVAGKIGKAVSAPNMLGNAAGKLDLGKVIGLGTGAANVIGANKQRQQAQRYTNANIDQRNQLMSRILASPNYNFSPEPMNTGTGAS